MLATLSQDFRAALRGIPRKPGFSPVVLATLALGIGANVAIFSVVNGVLLRPLPYREVDRIVTLQHREPYTTVSEPEFVDYRNGMTHVERMAAYVGASGTITGGTDLERVQVVCGGSRGWRPAHPPLRRASR